MSKGLYDLEKTLKAIDTYIGNMGSELADDLQQYFDKSVRFVLEDWYYDYTPKRYERTYNLLNNVTKSATVSRGMGNKIIFSVSSDYMSNYPGFWGQRLNADTAFEYMFYNGEHGHGRWLMDITYPSPYSDVRDSIISGFHGEAFGIIDYKIGKIFRGVC